MLIKTLLTGVLQAIKVDYVVEEGQEGIWTWRKWNSGIAECWCVYEDKTITSGYITFSFPFNFIGQPHQQTTAWYGSSSSRQERVLFITDSGTEDTYAIYLRNASGGIPTGTFAGYVSVKGKWK